MMNPLPKWGVVLKTTTTTTTISTTTTTRNTPHSQIMTMLQVFAPPGSGYSTPEDEELKLPSTYEPMMEYPGTMRPGRTPENMPFHDLPLGNGNDNDDDANDDLFLVPWPHFQQIEWHHRWDPPPHPHPIPMEVFIEQNGRWASAEDEAAMRAGARKNVRQQRDEAETERKSTILVDDDDDDDDDNDDDNDLVGMGEGMFGALGSGREEAITAAAVTNNPRKKNLDNTVVRDILTTTTTTDNDEEETDFDNFLLDLGLDSDNVNLRQNDSTSNLRVNKPLDDATKNLLDAMTSMLGEDSLDDDEDDDDDDDDLGLDFDLGLMDDPIEGTVDIKMDTDDIDEIDEASAVAALSDDEDLDIGLDEDDEDLSMEGGMSTVPLEDFGDDSLLDDDDGFDDGGFDYDGGDDFGDGGDNWN
jgi:hypothetical protein